MDFMKPETVLELTNVRDALVRMEDTIVFAFIERSQFFSTPSVYTKNNFDIPDFDGTFLDWSLLQIERTQSQIRRYESPDELPFFPEQILSSFLPPLEYPPVLASYSDSLNINDEIKDLYVLNIIPLISAGEGEQPENLGSTVFCDVDCLQTLSRRIHFGKFVAEAKFRSETERFTKLIIDRDVAGIEDAITNSALEQTILQRLVKKGNAYGTDPTLKYSQNPQSKVSPEFIAKIYKDWIIPLTMRVEVEYLLRRLEDEK
ncbi:hypothetical protein BABINDRAFT_42673 [Babjeviella inositovora NRRL Y-12698]|uniref:Chorismate mutase n=1 Tax=Babjeviella inositovora NRRL Y-12698 TaxID=984486 RepID=A0A1E3QGW3_9ASCO|nr:uncharacterized protein BABINDRAFT_42673 [Babjeviella inositovora NRRL Y-12698]ODQ76880.1 hypothetical protein BABINDRAFT_42673 [Babjeviella inositovora NRRL Y-12698]